MLPHGVHNKDKGGTQLATFPLFFSLAVLSEGIFLPHVSSFTYTDVSVVIHKVRNKTFKLLPAMFDLKGTQEQCLPPGSRINQSLLL